MLQYVNYMWIIETEFTKLKVKYVEGQHQKYWKVRSGSLKIHPTKLGNNIAPVIKDLGYRTLGTPPYPTALDGRLIDISHNTFVKCFTTFHFKNVWNTAGLPHIFVLVASLGYTVLPLVVPLALIAL